MPFLEDARALNAVCGIRGALREKKVPRLTLNVLERFLELEPLAVQTKSDLSFSFAERSAIPGVIVVHATAGKTIRSPAAAGKELHALADQARSYGVSLLYGLIGSAPHVFPLEAWAVSREDDVPLVLGTFHVEISKARPEEIAILPREVG